MNSLKFSATGPSFPSDLVDSLMDGDVVFLCGAGISAPQLPDFPSLVNKCFELLNVEKSAAEEESFKKGRFEESLGALGRRIVEPAYITRSVVDLLAFPQKPDLSQHEIILRLSKDSQSRHLVVTTNFDTMLEHALLKNETKERVKLYSLAGQDLPAPGSASFHGIIHLHGRVPDEVLDVDETPLVLTSADYGDAYMRSGWASRFLFDLSRCKTIVLIGYSAGDAPVRYFLNVLEADRQRFPELRSVYAFNAVKTHGQPDVSWESLAVIPIAYEIEEDIVAGQSSHAALWRDLKYLADLVERPRSVRKAMAVDIITQKFGDVSDSELMKIRWLFKGHRDLLGVAISNISDVAWLDFLCDDNILEQGDYSWFIAAWIAVDFKSVDRFYQGLKWVAKLGEPFVKEISQRVRYARELPEFWVRAWRLFSMLKFENKNWHMGAYAIKERLSSPFVSFDDLKIAIENLSPVLSLGTNLDIRFGRQQVRNPEKISDLVWARLSLDGGSDKEDLLEKLISLSQADKILSIGNSKFYELINLGIDIGAINGDYDSTNYDVPSIEQHHQNKHHGGIVLIVQLLAKLLPKSLEYNFDLTYSIASSWRTLPGLLGIRLWLHALRNAKLFSANAAISGMNELPINIFWFIRREIAMLIADRSGDASEEYVLILENRIITEGNGYYSTYQIADGQVDWRDHARDQAVWLNLNMLRKAGRLSKDGEKELLKIISNRQHLDREIEDIDFFGSYSTGVRAVVGNIQPLLEAADDNRLEVAHRERISRDINNQRGWAVYCGTDPDGAFITLKNAALDIVNAPLWADLVSSLSFLDEEKMQSRTDLITNVFVQLEVAEDAFISVLVRELADLYSCTSRKKIPSAKKWWAKLFSLAEELDKDQLIDSTDLYFYAINSPGGRLTRALLMDIEEQRAHSSKIPTGFLVLLRQSAVGKGRQGTFARAALVYEAGFVATIDGGGILTLLDSILDKSDAEGKALRFVLVADAHQSIGASKAFARHILRGAIEFEGKSVEANSAAAKLLAPIISVIRGEAKEADWGISAAEVANALRKSHESLRVGAINVLSQWIYQIEGRRADNWTAVIAPCLKLIWPSERNFLDKSSSVQFAKLALACESAFPIALRFVMPYLLQADSDEIVYFIESTPIPEDFPLETLDLLWRCFGGSNAPMLTVPNILERLIKACPNIELDRRLQWMERKATRYE